MEKEFIVLYTSQKQKKAKTWHDGTLKHDGKGTKAMLYDEKGGKLDTIHIKIEDITLGEQLESDRYYILVETVKSSDNTASEVIKAQAPAEDRPLAQKASYSQARCAGLKRKKTGFMPPRIVKQPKVEEQDSQERIPLRQQNCIYPSQSESSPVLSQSAVGFHQRCNLPETDPLCHSSEKNGTCDNVVFRENIRSMYSRNMKKEVNSESQESASSPLRSPIMSLSPWSVYGAKKNLTPNGRTCTLNDSFQNNRAFSADENIASFEKDTIIMEVQKRGSLSVKNDELSEQSNDMKRDISLKNTKESSAKTTIVSDLTSDRDQSSTCRSVRAIMDLLRKNKQNASKEKDLYTRIATSSVIPHVKPGVNHKTSLSHDKESSATLITTDKKCDCSAPDEIDLSVDVITTPVIEDNVKPDENKQSSEDNSKLCIYEDGLSDKEEFSIEDDVGCKSDQKTSVYVGDNDETLLTEVPATDNSPVGTFSDIERTHNINTILDTDTVIQSTIENQPKDVANIPPVGLVDMYSDEDEQDEEIQGCFSLSFSPLSHVTLSDSEDISEDLRTQDHDRKNPEIILSDNISINDQHDKGSHVLPTNSDTHPFGAEDVNDKEPQTSNEGRMKEGEVISAGQNEENHSTDLDDSPHPCKEKVSNMSLFDKNTSTQLSLNFANDSYFTTDKNTSGCMRTVPKARCDDSEEVDYSGNVISLSTQSQDTMEFSCDTLCDDSQNVANPEGIDSQGDDSTDRHDKPETVNQHVQNKFDKHYNVTVDFKSSGLNAKEHFTSQDASKSQECTENACYMSEDQGAEDQCTKETNSIWSAEVLKDSGSKFHEEMSKENLMTGNISPKMTIYRSDSNSYLMAGMKSVRVCRNEHVQPSKSVSILAPSVTDMKENVNIFTDSQALPIDTYGYTQSSDDSVEPTDDFDDEDVYGNLYKPRPMYQHVPEKLGAKLQTSMSQTRSSLQSYRAKVAESKALRPDPLLNVCENIDKNCLKPEKDCRNTPLSNTRLSQTVGRNHGDLGYSVSESMCEDNTDDESLSSHRNVPKPSPEDVNCADLQKDTCMSKWDQYVPNVVEEEIDLQKYKRKDNIPKDFSVVRIEQNTKSDRGNLEDFQSTSKIECKFQQKDICKTDMDTTFNQNKINVQSDSLFQKQSCDTDETWSVDSAELLMAADNAEQNLLVTDESCAGLTKRKCSYNNQISAVIDGNKSVISSDGRCRKGLVSIEGEYRTSNDMEEFNKKEADGKANFKSVTVPKKSNVNTVENSKIFSALQENTVPILNDSLDLSLSFEDEADNAYLNKPHTLGPTPVLRVGWKPQDQSLNQGKSMSSEEVKQAKPTSRCLDILAKARMSPDIDRNLSKETCLKSQCNKSSRLSETGIKGSVTSVNPVRSGYKSPLVPNQKNSEKNIPAVSRSQKSTKFRPPGMLQSHSSERLKTTQGRMNKNQTFTFNQELEQGVCCTELCFPDRETVEFTQNIARQVSIPATFKSVHQYKQILSSAVIENLNTVFFDISKRYHQALSRVDLSGYTKSAVQQSISISVLCNCGTAAKILSVRKEGPNKGRQFYSCSKNAQQRCKFFQWADGKVSTFNSGTGAKRRIYDGMSLGLYMKDQHVHLYPESLLIRKSKENIIPYFKRPKWVRGNHEEDAVQIKQLFLKLPRKGHSSLYAKDDVWIISKDLDFQPSTTFLARSTFYGPLSSNEVEIEPLYGYSPSNWSGDTSCHGILAGNASTELSCLDNIKEHLTVSSPPVIPHLLCRERQSLKQAGPSKFNIPRLVSMSTFTDTVLVGSDVMDDIVSKYIRQYGLNTDQTEALRRVSHMFTQEKASSVDDVLLLHGVFGAGKSFLLSVMVLFLVEVFKTISSLSSSTSKPVIWKLLISSTTNVAVDRILQGVLQLGFEDFVRVGSVKKIAKPILPYSIHASGTDNQELKDLQEMLRSSDITPAEKSHVRQSIEKHRHGENKKKLGAVKVVGVTCASCSVASLNNMEFPVVFLDECSQMTEPSSLLPIARFGCQKLLLVGDPKQLDPTIEGAKAAHDRGLEQTMFDRLTKMGYIPTILRKQYRCHPWISNISNQLFYGDILMDGVTETDRHPLLDVIPTICFYDVDRGQECCEGGGSFYNETEAQFVVFLLQVLTMSGIESQSIGVITLYRSQMSRITDLISTSGDNSQMKGIQVSTVDAFQGGERDIIILSCVRTQTCGFIDNDKRTNVALTRAKHHLLIVGHYKNLSSNFIWGKVLKHCQGHPNGICLADEATQKLKLYLENLSSQTCAEAFETKEGKPTRRKSSAKASKKDRSQVTETGIISPGSSGVLSGSSCREGYEISTPNSDDIDYFSPASCGHDAEMSNFRDGIIGSVPDDGPNSNDALDQKMNEFVETEESISRSLSHTRNKRAVHRRRYGDRLGSEYFIEADVDSPVFQ